MKNIKEKLVITDFKVNSFVTETGKQMKATGTCDNTADCLSTECVSDECVDTLCDCTINCNCG